MNQAQTPTRHQSRIIALQFLYKKEASEMTQASVAQLSQEILAHFDHFHVEDGCRRFSSELIAGTLIHIQKIDEAIEQTLQNWKKGRIAKVDIAILRLAFFELLFCRETDTAVILDEAIELAKEFGTSESSGFVNGILDGWAKKNQR